MEPETILTHIVYPLIVGTWTLMLGLHIKLLTFLVRAVLTVQAALESHHTRLETLEGDRKK